MFNPTDNQTDLDALSALELGQAIAAGRLSPSEAVQHFAAKPDRFGAYITPTPEQAAEHAQALDSRPDDAGPLFGVPTAIKDLTRTAGVRTTFGSAVYRDFVPTESDRVAQALIDAGLPSLGKTNTPEFGAVGYSEPDVAAPAVSPWDPTRTAGGSSGGSAAAVAAGLVPVATASDGGGSARIPAACCGVVGYKPSRGLMSGAPDFGDITGFTTPGTLARTVADAAALADVMTGDHLGDPFWNAPEPAPLLAACQEDPGPLRIARISRAMMADTAVAPESTAALDDACGQLSALGHEVVDIEPPLTPETLAIFGGVWPAIIATMPVPDEAMHLLRPITRWLIESGRATSAPQYAQLISQVRQHSARALATLHGFDAVISPTIATLPPLVGALRNDDDPMADFMSQSDFSPWASGWNATGMASISLPTYWEGDFPMSVMLGTAPGRDDLLFSLAAQLERAKPWREHYRRFQQQ
ncbi:MAG: amidase [Arachnia propionica]|nr:MAG: amidase [Arachnia propionica]